MRSATAPTAMVGRSLFVEVGGDRLHVLEYGDPGAPALFVVPGITSPAATWDFVALELAADSRVLVLDVRGRGLSDVGLRHGVDDYARDLAGVISKLDLDRPAVLGHSAGARVVTVFGVRYPELRGPLVVADPPLSGPGRPPYPTPLDAFLEQIRLARAGATAADLRPYSPSLSDQALALRLAWLPTCDETAVADTYRWFHEEDFFGDWARLEPPVLFLWGGVSPAVSEAAATEVTAANPKAESACLELAGHMLPWDDLGGFLDLVRAFLTAADARSTPTRTGPDA